MDSNFRNALSLLLISQKFLIAQYKVYIFYFYLRNISIFLLNIIDNIFELTDSDFISIINLTIQDSSGSFGNAIYMGSNFVSNIQMTGCNFLRLKPTQSVNA